MELTVRGFCERVVLGETLEAKLEAPPASIIDDDRGAGTKIRAPGRPRELLPVRREREPMPRVSQLASPEKCAICLHRFANHELQAIEIMAWALLAFPEAPAAMRRGILATLAEEQAHLRLYSGRLGQLGLRFGELPVNDYFWSKVQDIETPLHYLAAMGLTFEAGNLDHSFAYRDAFAREGDRESAAILARIHEDEVGHVRFALTWLRALKESGASDWEAYVRHLRFPLGPHRAKGAVFQEAPRLAAGFSPDFVAALA
ncbi:DUF455 family protein, partial [bacterium]|nr:DUF455 family protein [bacterium]